MTADRQKSIIKTVKAVIADRYDEPKRRKVRPPLDQLMLSTLWRYTGVKSGVRAFRKLKNSFVDWNEMRVSTISEISAAISSAGWTYGCAEHMRQMLTSLFHLRNVVKMDFMDDFTQSEATTFLRSLQGVTKDLADEVLLFNYEANKIPMTDYGTRMCFRMGLIEKNSPTIKNQRTLTERLEKEYHVGFSLFLHDYAKDVCVKENPKHSKCPLEKVCPRTGVSE